MNDILAYDFGTGGIKSTLITCEGRIVASAFSEYPTFYESGGFQEQAPSQWWDALVLSTKTLLDQAPGHRKNISCIGISGHSLGVVAVDQSGKALTGKTPIWSDSRAQQQANDFFSKVCPKEWYQITGGGFPAHLYAAFKIKWYQENQPELYRNTNCFIGSKDYINAMLTGVVATDYSYASGSGVYHLRKRKYHLPYLTALELSSDKLPDVVASNKVLGTLTKKAAALLGLPQHVSVVCGGVDNACMALGANCFTDGSSYTSLGTSAWIAVSSREPVINQHTKPYVFEHCVEGQYVSATAIFSAGRSLQWCRDELCKDITLTAKKQGRSAYTYMDRLAEDVPAGARKLIFNPSLSGGSSLDRSPNLKGSFSGLSLMHTQADVIRSVMEGIALNLRLALDALEEETTLKEEMLIVGGGANSTVWKQIFADAYDRTVVETEIGQDAGTIGAAALAAVGSGLWDDFSLISKMHIETSRIAPTAKHTAVYESLLPVFKKIADCHSDIDDILSSLSF